GAQRRVADDFDAATALAEGGDVLGNGLVRHAVRSDGLGRGTSHESPSERGGESRHLTRSALILQIKPPNLGQNAAIFADLRSMPGQLQPARGAVQFAQAVSESGDVAFDGLQRGLPVRGK